MQFSLARKGIVFWVDLEAASGKSVIMAGKVFTKQIIILEVLKKTPLYGTSKSYFRKYS